MTLRVGMISFAHSNHPERYMSALLKNGDVTLVGVWDDVPSRALAHTKPAGIPFIANLDDLLTSVDAVVICSEYDMHAEHVERALARGLHVLCEKPLAQSRENVTRIEDAVNASSTVFMVALPCRYIPAIIHARDAIIRGDIGELLAINSTNRGACPGSWFIDPERSGGGAIMDHTAHMADIIQWVSGTRITQVFASTSHNLLGTDIEDAAFLQVILSSGSIATIDASWSRRVPLPSTFDITMTIVGTKGEIHVDALNQRVSEFSDSVRWEMYAGSIDDAMVDEFIATIICGFDSPIPISAGVSATNVSFAAYDSIVTRGPVAI